MAERSFTGRTVYIHCADGSFLKTKIIAYDGKTNEIEIAEAPGLKKGDSCKVVIDTSPLPWEYTGRVLSTGVRPVSIALYGEKPYTSENRQNPRFKARMSAVIERLIEDERVDALYLPMEVGIIDISQSGVRICTPKDVIAVGVRFEMRLRIGDEDELLIAEAVNGGQSGPQSFEYGCAFLEKNGN